MKLITNVTDGIIIYQFNDVTKNGTVSGNILTLTYDTTAMGDSDTLMIVYDEPTERPMLSGIAALLERIFATIARPPWSTYTVNGQTIKVLISSTDSTIPNMTNVTVGAISKVTSVNALNSVDSRWVVWNQWNDQYKLGLRNRIT